MCDFICPPQRHPTVSRRDCHVKFHWTVETRRFHLTPRRNIHLGVAALHGSARCPKWTLVATHPAHRVPTSVISAGQNGYNRYLLLIKSPWSSARLSAGSRGPKRPLTRVRPPRQALGGSPEC